MDGHIARLLNIGVAMMLLVFGLSVFFTQMRPLMAYEYGETGLKDSRITDTGRRLDDRVVKSELYWRIADGSGTALTEGGPGISIYVDGVFYPKAVDYQSRQQLMLQIRGLASETFDKVMRLDEQGKIRAIDYIGR